MKRRISSMLAAFATWQGMAENGGVLSFCPSPQPQKVSSMSKSGSLVLAATNKDFAPEALPDALENALNEMDAIYEHAMKSSKKSWKNGELSKYYRRDADDDVNVPVADETGLRKLLTARFYAYRKRNMDKVRKIDHTLKVNHGVQAYDHPNVWTRQSQPPISELRRRARTGITKMKAMYGPTGHPFQQFGGPIDPIFCSLSMTQIHTLLSRWMQTRSLNRYEEADSIRFELRLQGVYFDDRSNLWRADGETGFPKKFLQETRKTPTMPSKYYLKVTDHQQSKVPPKSLRRIDQLVAMRSSAIVRDETLRANFIEFELWKAYKVGVNDTTLTYFFPRDQERTVEWKPPTLPSHQNRASAFASFPPVLLEHQVPIDREAQYAPAGSGYEHVLGHSVQERIQCLVQARQTKVEERKLIEADAILHELFRVYAVKVDDSTREWYLDLKKYQTLVDSSTTG